MQSPTDKQRTEQNQIVKDKATTKARQTLEKRKGQGRDSMEKALRVEGGADFT